MSKITIVGGDIIESIGGKDLSFAREDIVNSSDKQVIMSGKESGVSYGKNGGLLGSDITVNIKEENIIIVGAEVHDETATNKLMFMAQATRKVRIDKIQTILYFEQGYSKNMIIEFEKSVKKYNKDIILIGVLTLSHVINYINTGSVIFSPNNKRKYPDDKNNVYKVKNIYMYSHGMPSRITFLLDWDNYKLVNKIESRESSTANELNLSNYIRLNPESFSENASIWSYACRTGLSEDNNTDLEFITWGANESLAQKMANFLNVKIFAFLKRSSYEDTWGSKYDRLSLKSADLREKILPKEWVTDDDNFRNYKSKEMKIDDKYIWQPQGAYRDVKAGNTPYGPPNCLCIFQKNKDMYSTCNTMKFPLG